MTYSKLISSQSGRLEQWNKSTEVPMRNIRAVIPNMPVVLVATWKTLKTGQERGIMLLKNGGGGHEL